MDRILSSAIRFNERVWDVPRPGRHHDVIRHIIETNPAVQTVGGEQGFLAGDGSSQGRFVERIEARKIAEAAGQIIAGRRDNDGIPYVSQDDRLFSEDVW
jgi:hypothetical protein